MNSPLIQMAAISLSPRPRPRDPRPRSVEGRRNPSPERHRSRRERYEDDRYRPPRKYLPSRSPRLVAEGEVQTGITDHDEITAMTIVVKRISLGVISHCHHREAMIIDNVDKAL